MPEVTMYTDGTKRTRFKREEWCGVIINLLSNDSPDVVTQTGIHTSICTKCGGQEFLQHEGVLCSKCSKLT